MIKTLATSGGDFTTPDQWLTYLHAAYSTIAMTVDEELWLEPGQLFTFSAGAKLIDYSVAGNNVVSGGYKIIIKTNPTYNLLSIGPGFLHFSSTSPMVMKLHTVSGSATLEMRGIGLSIDSDSPTATMIQAGSFSGAGRSVKCNINVYNSVVLFRTSANNSDYTFINVPSGTGSPYHDDIEVENNLILMWHDSTSVGSDTSFNIINGDATKLDFTNNNIVTYIDYDDGVNFGADIFGNTENVVSHNTLENYWSFNGEFLSDYADATNTIGPIGYTTQLIQSANESMDTVRNRIFSNAHRLLGSETNVIDNGSTYSPSTDYAGTVRFTGEGIDRGPWEVLPSYMIRIFGGDNTGVYEVNTISSYGYIKINESFKTSTSSDGFERFVITHDFKTLS